MTESSVVRLPIHQQLVCSACGAPGEGSCRCGAPYVAAIKRAAAAVAEKPEGSVRQIAKDAGVSKSTVHRAKKSGVPHGTPVKVKGADGKSYPAKRKAPSKAKKPAVSMKDEVNQMLRVISDVCDKVEEFLEARVAELEQEDNDPNVVMSAKTAIMNMLYTCADQMAKLAQKIDGR